jgi:hypothetical protein
VEHQAIKDNAAKQRVRAFPNLMEHQAIKDNAAKQRVRAKCRFYEDSFCSSLPLKACHSQSTSGWLWRIIEKINVYILS